MKMKVKINPILRCGSMVIECMAKGLFGLQRIDDSGGSFLGIWESSATPRALLCRCIKFWGCLKSIPPVMK